MPYKTPNKNTLRSQCFLSVLRRLDHKVLTFVVLWIFSVDQMESSVCIFDRLVTDCLTDRFYLIGLLGNQLIHRLVLLCWFSR